MSLPQRPSELDDNLHTLNLAFDITIKVLLLDFRERQEVHRANIGSVRGRGNKRLQPLVDILRDEWGIRRLVEMSAKIRREYMRID